ncbi:MAG: sulfurtransferase [Candidatus Planktophila sp.]|jgi:thiosulfate/3-mercaptopyruvate sulfurtransferase|tara:strand:+ start:1877 stop:2725 length:849 start_codon:yes stop_codon:yes gene_type:complete
MTYTTLISTEDLARNLMNPVFVIFDVRFTLDDEFWGKNVYGESHIPGAIHADVSEHLSGEIILGKTGRRPFPKAEDFAKQLSKWGITPETQVICYDAESGLMAASRLWLMFRWMGHDQVAVLDGGLKIWLREGREVNQEVRSMTPTSFKPKIREELFASVEEVDAVRNDPNHRVFDSRGAEGYHGGGKYYDPVRGHIAGAGLADRAETLTKDSRFRPQEELKEHYANLLGEVSPSNTIFYCGSGITAAQNVLAMKSAGFDDCKMYIGSWSEWITDPNRAIEL